jgi:tetratricopeptide (TPR) repeat protein
MASMFLMIEDQEHAMQCLLRAVGLDVRSVEAHYYLGVAAANKGQLTDAERFLAHTLELDPNHTGALRDSTFTLLALGHIDRAGERIARARVLLPDDCELRMLDYSVRLLRAFHRLGRIASRLNPRRILRALRR